MTGDEAAAQHVVRTLRALELFSEGSQTQASLAQHLGVHRRTARRLIARLLDEGYLETKESSGRLRYVASSRLVVLGGRVAAGLDLVEIVRRHLSDLGAMPGEPFIARRHIDSVSVTMLEDPDLKSRDRSDALAGDLPLHATAAGKVFLSADNRLAEKALNHDVLTYTGKTITSRADLLVELANVRVNGYATEDEEHFLGQRAVASGVTDYTGNTVAAVGANVSKETDLREVAARIREAAGACSRSMGGELLGPG